jgi:thymidylate synthase (FAD)
MNKINRKELYNDNIGFVEQYDFSTANTSQEARVEAVTTISSVCYDKEAKDKIKRFDLLESESLGLPSTSFEFIPVLISIDDYEEIESTTRTCVTEYDEFILNIVKYGQWVKYNKEEYLLTNLRACLNDEKMYQIDRFCDIDFKTYFNTSSEEIQIIKDNFKVFFQKIPLFVARQLIRHRVSYQELSRRYTSDKTSPIEFYVKNSTIISHGVKAVNEIKFNLQCALNGYKNLIAMGVKPEDARAVLPLAMYTKLWSAWLPDAYDNFIKLRTKESAQAEIRELAKAMKNE